MWITKCEWRTTRLPIMLPDGAPLGNDEPGYMITAKCGPTIIRIAIIEESHYLPPAAAKAAAQLIVSAPGMLALLEEIMASDGNDQLFFFKSRISQVLSQCKIE